MLVLLVKGNVAWRVGLDPRHSIRSCIAGHRRPIDAPTNWPGSKLERLWAERALEGISPVSDRVSVLAWESKPRTHDAHQGNEVDSERGTGGGAVLTSGLFARMLGPNDPASRGSGKHAGGKCGPSRDAAVEQRSMKVTPAGSRLSCDRSIVVRKTLSLSQRREVKRTSRTLTISLHYTMWRCGVCRRRSVLAHV